MMHVTTLSVGEDPAWCFVGIPYPVTSIAQLGARAV